MCSSRLVLLALLSTALFAIADEPRSKAAVSAIDRFNDAKAKLDADYQARLAAATQSLHQELTNALKAATRAGKLEEANAIQAIIDRVNGATKTFQIDAARDWQPTLEVRKGQTIAIDVEGEWLTDASRPDLKSDANGLQVGRHFVMYLEGRIGEGQAFRVGNGTSLKASADGMLQLRCYDPHRQDNAGSVAAYISITDAPSLR